MEISLRYEQANNHRELNGYPELTHPLTEVLNFLRFRFCGCSFFKMSAIKHWLFQDIIVAVINAAPHCLAAAKKGMIHAIKLA